MLRKLKRWNEAVDALLNSLLVNDELESHRIKAGDIIVAGMLEDVSFDSPSKSKSLGKRVSKGAAPSGTDFSAIKKARNIDGATTSPNFSPVSAQWDDDECLFFGEKVQVSTTQARCQKKGRVMGTRHNQSSSSSRTSSPHIFSDVLCSLCSCFYVKPFTLPG